VLLSLGLLCRTVDYLSNLDFAALRAMTGPEGEGAVMLFVTFGEPLKLCGDPRFRKIFLGELSLQINRLFF